MLSESQLVKKVKLILEKEYETFEEVKIFTRSIDLVLKSNTKLISIEFKLRDWNKAFKQISDYQLVSDYSYLCIPKKNLRIETINKIKEKGIGLFLYDNETDELKEAIKPLPSSKKIDYYRDYLHSRLKYSN